VDSLPAQGRIIIEGATKQEAAMRTTRLTDDTLDAKGNPVELGDWEVRVGSDTFVVRGDVLMSFLDEWHNTTTMSIPGKRDEDTVWFVVDRATGRAVSPEFATREDAVAHRTRNLN
jgi:hypothetical protein